MKVYVKYISIGLIFTLLLEFCIPLFFSLLAIIFLEVVSILIIKISNIKEHKNFIQIAEEKEQHRILINEVIRLEKELSINKCKEHIRFKQLLNKSNEELMEEITRLNNNIK